MIQNRFKDTTVLYDENIKAIVNSTFNVHFAHPQDFGTEKYFLQMYYNKYYYDTVGVVLEWASTSSCS